MFVASTYYYSEISSIMSLLGVYIHLALCGARGSLFDWNVAASPGLCHKCDYLETHNIFLWRSVMEEMGHLLPDQGDRVCRDTRLCRHRPGCVNLSFVSSQHGHSIVLVHSITWDTKTWSMKHSIPSEGIIPGYFIHINTTAGVWAVDVCH